MTTHDCEHPGNATVVLKPHGVEHDKRDSEMVAQAYARRLAAGIKDSPWRRVMIFFGLADSKRVR